MLRGGAGLFTGRFLLVPAFIELQQNGVTGRIVTTRINGLAGWACRRFVSALDPATRSDTGILLKPHITLLDQTLDEPLDATRPPSASPRKLGDTGLFADLEGIYVEGDDEIIVRDLNFGGNSPPGAGRTRATPRSTSTPTRATRSTRPWSPASTARSRAATCSRPRSPAPTRRTSPTTSARPWRLPQRPGRHRGRVGPQPRPTSATARGHLGHRSPALGPRPWRRSSSTARASRGTPAAATTTTATARTPTACPASPRYSEDGPSYTSFALRLTKRFKLGGRAGLDLIAEGVQPLRHGQLRRQLGPRAASITSGPTVSNPAGRSCAEPAASASTPPPCRRARSSSARGDLLGGRLPSEPGPGRGPPRLSRQPGPRSRRRRCNEQRDGSARQGRDRDRRGGRHRPGHRAALRRRGGARRGLGRQATPGGEDLLGRAAPAGGRDALFGKVNVADAASVQAGVARSCGRWGRIDVLVNNAGIVRDAQLVKWKDGQVAATMTDEAWDAVIGVNLRGVFLCTRAVVPHMIARRRRGGPERLLGGRACTATSARPTTRPPRPASSRMTKTWARELGRYKIRVNAVAPGFIATEILRAMPEKVLDVDGRAHPDRAHGPAGGHRQRLRLAGLRPGRRSFTAPCSRSTAAW